MLFSDLQSLVNTAAIDLPPKVQAQVPTLINEAIRTVQRGYNFRAMETSTLMLTTPGDLTPTPSTIANFKEYMNKGPYLLRYLVEAKRYVTTSGADAALARLDDATNPSEPIFLENAVDQTTGAVTFKLHPYPDQLSDWPDGNYRIVVPAYVYTAPLANAGDTNWFTLNMDDYIWRKAAAEAFSLDWDYNSMAVWLQRAEEFRKQAINADKTSRLGSVDTFVPFWQGANQPQVRR